MIGKHTLAKCLFLAHAYPAINAKANENIIPIINRIVVRNI
ncbi:hypothetical protein FNFX1_0147 [Francisella cf. novicida Fx1]|nr:hypothetical protein FNFX1_0147 [Francisella cf. novicida Fx1]